MPIGIAVAQFDEKRDRFEAALDAEVSFAFRRGLLRVDILPGKIPDEPIPLEPAAHLDERLKTAGELPFIIGAGREGLITSDLTACPHLLVAGQTGAGKSNFLHTLIACLRQTGCVLHIIDLKRVEFAYLKKQVSVKYNMTGALDTLEVLTMEMQRRMAFLERAGHVSAKEWRTANRKRAGELPYHVLVVDEFSQLCPGLSKDRADREARTYAHKLLTDLISLARSLGINVVIATQYPHHDILPGTLKQHLPATIAFKVRDEVASRVCLGSSRAAKLPEPKELPGRAVWQHDVEREVQALHMPMAVARELMSREVSREASRNLSQQKKIEGQSKS